MDKTANREALRDFFRSDDMLAFIDEHSVGERPWEVVLDGSRRVVLTDAGRSTFYVVSAGSTSFAATVTDDPLAVIDPESESARELGDYPTASEAFAAALDDAGLKAAAPAC